MNFDYGNVLTRALQITWKHKSYWLFMMLPVLISFFIFATLAVPVIFFSDNEEMVGLFLVIWVGLMIAGMIFSLLASTAGNTSLMLGVLRAERGEGSTSFMDLVRDGFQYFGRALGVVLIVQLTIGAVFTVFFLCSTILSVVTMGMATLCLQPVMLLLAPLSFLVVAVMNGGIVAVIDEGLGAWEAVKRAIQVVRDHVWKFVLITLVIYFGTTFLTSIFIFPAMIPAMAGPIYLESGAEINGQMIMLILIPFFCLFFGLMSLLSGVTGTFMTSSLGISYLRLSRPAKEEVVVTADEPQNATS